MEWSTHTIYVRKQDLVEHIGDMLDYARCQTNVACRWEIGAHILDDAKNAPPRTKGKKPLDGILRIKFSPSGVEQCEGEE